MNNNQVLLHLSLIPNIGPAITEKVLHAVKGLDFFQTIYGWSFAQWRSKNLTDLQAQTVVDGLRDTAVLHKELELIAKHKVQVVTILDEQYPQELKNIYRPPVVLYCWGKPLYEYQQTVAVVGARAATGYGRRVVNQLIPDLVAQGFAIVSGGAAGIDAFAHRATLDCGGNTIAVMGSGLLQLYPTSNKKLFQNILDNNGTLVSSFPLTMEALPGHFPARNRIISGLSQGTLVVQAAVKSGSLITANYALEQGKEVFAVPGPIDDRLSAGCHILVQQGAKLVYSATDIVIELLSDIQRMPMVQSTIFRSTDVPLVARRQERGKVTQITKNCELLDQNTPEGKIVYACNKPQSTDDLLLVTGLQVVKLQNILFNLQISGAISQNSAGLWERL